MKLELEKLELSGKGIELTTEVIQDNVKMVASQSQFHEVVSTEEKGKRVGWIIPNNLEVIADFTSHTKHGMRGKSTRDVIKRTFLIDNKGLFERLQTTQLDEIDTRESQTILEAMFSSNFSGKLNFDNNDHHDATILISPASDFVFIHSDESTIRVHSKEGVYILKHGKDGEKLIIIDKNEGINVVGEKDISVGSDGIMINGEYLDTSQILQNAMNSLNISLATLSTIGEEIGKAIGLKFSKHFSDNFGSEDDFDLDFDDAFDVDIDYS